MNLVLSTVAKSELTQAERAQLEKIESLPRTRKNTVQNFMNQNKWLRREVKSFVSINHLANPYEYAFVVIASKVAENPVLGQLLESGYMEDEDASMSDEKSKEIADFLQLNHSWIEPILKYYLSAMSAAKEREKLSKAADRVKRCLNSIKKQLRTDNFGRLLIALNELFESEPAHKTPANPRILSDLIRALRMLNASNEEQTSNSHLEDFFGDSSDHSDSDEAQTSRRLDFSGLNSTLNTSNASNKSTRPKF